MSVIAHSSLSTRLVGMGINLGAIANAFNAELAINTADATVIDSAGREHTLGETSGTFNVEGFLTSESEAGAEDGSWDALKRALGANSIIIRTRGDVVGKPAAGMVAGTTKGAVMPSVGANVGVKIEGETQAGPDLGWVLVPWGVQTTLFEGAAHDVGAAVSGVQVSAYVCWSDFDGTDLDLVLQHSIDGSTWADVAAFPTITAERGGAHVIATGGTLNRHRRIIADGGTFTSVQLVAMVATINKPDAG